MKHLIAEIVRATGFFCIGTFLIALVVGIIQSFKDDWKHTGFWLLLMLVGFGIAGWCVSVFFWSLDTLR